MLVVGSAFAVVVFGLAGQAALAPLGAVTMFANTVLAWKFLREPFFRIDGVSLGLMGAGTTVALVFAQHADQVLDVYSITELLKRPIVWVFSALAAGCIIYMARRLSTLGARPARQLTHAENRFDATGRAVLGGLLGGFTAFATKSFVESTGKPVLGGDLDVLTMPQPYLFLLMLALVLSNQLRCLNSGLARHESSRVVPVYQATLVFSSVSVAYVFFNEAAQQTTLSLALFGIGCLITTSGMVLMLAKPRLRQLQVFQHHRSRLQSAASATTTEDFGMVIATPSAATTVVATAAADATTQQQQHQLTFAGSLGGRSSPTRGLRERSESEQVLLLPGASGRLQHDETIDTSTLVIAPAASTLRTNAVASPTTEQHKVTGSSPSLYPTTPTKPHQKVPTHDKTGNADQNVSLFYRHQYQHAAAPTTFDAVVESILGAEDLKHIGIGGSSHLDIDDLDVFDVAEDAQEGGDEQVPANKAGQYVHGGDGQSWHAAFDVTSVRITTSPAAPGSSSAAATPVLASRSASAVSSPMHLHSDRLRARTLSLADNIEDDLTPPQLPSWFPEFVHSLWQWVLEDAYADARRKLESARQELEMTTIMPVPMMAEHQQRQPPRHSPQRGEYHQNENQSISQSAGNFSMNSGISPSFSVSTASAQQQQPQTNEDGDGVVSSVQLVSSPSCSSSSSSSSSTASNYIFSGGAGLSGISVASDCANGTGGTGGGGAIASDMGLGNSGLNLHRSRARLQ